MVLETRRPDRRTVGQSRSIERQVRHHEDRAFAGRVRFLGNRIQIAVVAERDDVVQQSAGELVFLASRRLRQLDGGEIA